MDIAPTLSRSFGRAGERGFIVGSVCVVAICITDEWRQMKTKRLVVLGMMGQAPFGGQAWMHMNWLRGFARLGHEVWYIEDSTAWPYDPIQNTLTEDCRYAVNHVARCMEYIGLKDRWAYR